MSFVFLIHDSVTLVEIWVKAHNSFITGLISERNCGFIGKEMLSATVILCVFSLPLKWLQCLENISA